MPRIALIATLLFATLFAPCAACAGEWIALFNGNDLDGWEQKGGAAHYTVEDGVIVGSSVPDTGNSFLCTKAHYGDFVLELEFMGHPNLNSGVQVRSESLPEYKEGRVHGYQVELEQETRDRYWSGGIYDEGRRGWLFPMKSETPTPEQKAFGEQGKRVWKFGEWNHIKVEAKGDTIKTWVNGEPRADLTDDMTHEGFIALQVHGVGDKKEPMSVKWRNIRLMALEK